MYKFNPFTRNFDLVSSGSGGGSSTPGGSDTQVQFNDGGSFGGDSGFIYIKGTDTLTAGNLKVTSYIKDNSDVVSLSPTIRTLYDSSGADSVLWDERKLRNSSGTIFEWNNTYVEFIDQGTGWSGGIDASLLTGDHVFQIPNQDGVIALLTDIPNDSNLVHLTGDEHISGKKSFNSGIYDHIGGNVRSIDTSGRQLVNQDGEVILDWSANSIEFHDPLSGQQLTFDTTLLGANRTVTFQDGDGTVAFLSDITGGYTDEQAQDAVGGMVDSTLVYVDGTPTLKRAPITGDISIPDGSNTATLPTVNSNVGTFVSGASYTPQITVNAKGQVTAASQLEIAISQSQVSNLITALTLRPKALFQYYADATVGGTEADIYSSLIGGYTLDNNGDKIISSYSGNFVTVGTELTQLKVYFGGTAIYDSTGVAPTTGTTSWRVYVELIKSASGSVRYSVSLNTTGASGFVYETCGELTGLTLTGSNTLKITGTSSGVGSGSGDIVGKMGMVSVQGAA